MAARKRILKKRPDFRLRESLQEPESEDLKKVKAEALKDLEERKKNEKEWYDIELEKNMKNQ